MSNIFLTAILCFVLRNAVEWKETGGRANSAQVLAVDGKGSNRNVRELVSCSSALPCRLQVVGCWRNKKLLADTGCANYADEA